MRIEGETAGLVRILIGGGDGGEDRFSYRVSEVEIRSNHEIEQLEPFAIPPGLPATSEPAARSPEEWQQGRLAGRELPVVYDGGGWVGGREVAVVGRGAGLEHRVDIEDGTVLLVARRDGECLVEMVVGSDPPASIFALLGPGLALALALLGRFSLHASAVVVGGRPLVIMGESGSGKSTMSALASQRLDCRRLADDVVPVRVLRRGELHLLPRFPQLKLASSEQWTGDPDLSCNRVVTLERDVQIAAPQLSELSARDGVLRLLESTVGSRLFSPELREQQLDTWARAAAGSQFSDWRVPDDPDRLVESFESLAAL